MENNTNQKDEEETALPKEERRESIIFQKKKKGMNTFNDADAILIDFSNWNVRRPFPRKSEGGGKETFQMHSDIPNQQANFCVRSFLILRMTVEKRHRHSHSIHSTHTQTHADTRRHTHTPLTPNDTHSYKTHNTQQTHHAHYRHDSHLSHNTHCCVLHSSVSHSNVPSEWQRSERICRRLRGKCSCDHFGSTPVASAPSATRPVNTDLHHLLSPAEHQLQSLLHGAQCSRRHLLWFTQYLISVRVRLAQHPLPWPSSESLLCGLGPAVRLTRVW